MTLSGLINRAFRARAREPHKDTPVFANYLFKMNLALSFLWDSYEEEEIKKRRTRELQCTKFI